MSTNAKFDQMKNTMYLKPSNRYTIWKVAGILIVGLLLTCTMFVFYFVYQYSYLTLANANAIVSLSTNLGMDMVDNKNFTLSQDIINSKNSLPEITTKVRNIFYYVETSTSTPTSSTKIKQP
ncbi:MAG: hypothetical protein WCV83_03165 [Candidatus Magasanikbacteria bacterium]|jgi:hypothetical protein